MQQKLVSGFLLCLAASSACLSVSSAVAAESVDQSHYFDPDPNPYRNSAWAGDALAQTFTVGVTGRLTALDLLLDDASEQLNTDLFRIEIRPVVDGVPSANPSSARTFADYAAAAMPYLGPDWRRYDLPPADVVAGEQLAIVISPTGQARVTWGGDIGGYAGGEPFARRLGETAFTPTGFFPFGTGVGDFGFQTYVATVPEPGTLLVVAAAGAWACARGRRPQRPSH